jgi:hypothetical protein
MQSSRLSRLPEKAAPNLEIATIKNPADLSPLKKDVPFKESKKDKEELKIDEDDHIDSFV